MLSAIRIWFKENAPLAISGEGWTKVVSSSTREDLRWFFLDGVFGASLDGIVASFVSLYLLSLGATSSQIGLMISLAGVWSTVTLLPGAVL